MKASQSLYSVFRNLKPTLPARPSSSLYCLAPHHRVPNHIPQPSTRAALPHHYPAYYSTTRSYSAPVSSSASESKPTSPSTSIATDSQDSPSKPPPPAYELTFTCKPCLHRSSHTVSKQGYHKGTVLITCPECKNRHVISDHLKIFEDQAFTIEDLMRRKGELVKRGHLGGEGDVEFWDDGSEAVREKN